ncbi:MAG: ECF transporter S component [Bacillota bacterium]|nr:ECF transporter S component [Bacillota bacterium]
MQKRTRRLVLIGLLASMSFLLMYFAEFPLPFFPPFLKYDPSGVPSVLAALAIGPGTGVAVELVKSLLFVLSGKDPTGVLGPAAAFLAGGSMALVCGLAYRRWRRRGRLWVALGSGVLASTALMSLGNYFVFLPAYGVPPGEVAGMIVRVVLPFNLVKGVITGILVFAAARRFPPENLSW